MTGATGFLGQSVVEELLHNNAFEVIAISGRPEDKVNSLPEDSRLKTFSLEDLFSQSFGGIDTVINCAFARSNDAALLANAFDFTEKLIDRLKEIKAKSVINISSQGVYKRLPQGELSSEESPIVPVDLYSMAKYASEKFFLASSIPNVTNIRLASLLMPQRFLYIFIQKALNHEPITLTAPNQYASLLDVSDAASGIVSIAALDPEKRASTYNLGIGTQYSLLQYTERVKEIGDKLGYSVVLNISDNGTSVCAGMDISRLVNDTGWKPKILIDEMIENLYHALENK